MSSKTLSREDPPALMTVALRYIPPVGSTQHSHLPTSPLPPISCSRSSRCTPTYWDSCPSLMLSPRLASLWTSYQRSLSSATRVQGRPVCWKWLPMQESSHGTHTHTPRMPHWTTSIYMDADVSAAHTTIPPCPSLRGGGEMMTRAPVVVTLMDAPRHVAEFRDGGGVVYQLDQESEV